MRKFILKLLGGVDRNESIRERVTYAEGKKDQIRKFYLDVIDKLQATGEIPPHLSLLIPKKSIIITDEHGEVIASNGTWKKLPSDGVRVTISYDRS